MVNDSFTSKEEMLQRFLVWCRSNKMKFSDKIEVVCSGTSHRYGVIAKQRISPGELLVKIPRILLLSPKTTKIRSHLREFRKYLRSTGRRYEKFLKHTSGWIPLTLSLMYEYMDKLSFWRPYLDLIPLPENCGHPMFWSKFERTEELNGLPILKDVESDLEKMEQEYQMFARGFISHFLDSTQKHKMDFDLYKQMVAFIMSYSFTESSEGPSMVPMADIFNHHSCNNTHLIFQKTHLRMVSTQTINKGEEIFNTFGKLGNDQLLHMYGFIESGCNPYNTLHLSIRDVLKGIRSQYLSSRRLLKWKLAYLRNMDIIDDADDGFSFSTQGIMFGPNPKKVMEILHLQSSIFMVLYWKHIKMTTITPLRSNIKSRLKRNNRISMKRFAKKTRAKTGQSLKIVHDEKENTQWRRGGRKEGVSYLVENTADMNKREKVTDFKSLNESNIEFFENNTSAELSSDLTKKFNRVVERNGTENSNKKEDIPMKDFGSTECDIDNNVIPLYTFEEMREIFKYEWIVTIKNATQMILKKLKCDSMKEEKPLSARQLMTRRLRNGKRQIIQKILNSL